MNQTSNQEVLGLEQGIVRLAEYTPLWSELFAAEAVDIRNVLGDLALDVQHVGSTAIPGLKSKPVLDIAVAITTLNDLPIFELAFRRIGYEYAHWAGIEDNLVFCKGFARTHLVHVVEGTSKRWRNYIEFRDALRESYDLASEYEQLKIALAKKYPANRARYTDEKQQFIHRVLREA